jgi:tetratricopeptide (TPR) repeat protein
MEEEQSNTQLIPWRTFSIFISSTFADMQAERDYLKTFVFPKVEEELQQRRIKLRVVDLRWGVDTSSIDQEDQREATVLKVCLEEIKRCRPFFIGLLGDRYGWIPPEERVKNALATEDTEINPKDKSVTALEIEFGVLASKEQLMRSVFYFHDSLPYDKFSPERAAMYSDAHNAKLSEAEKKKRQVAFSNLKESIRIHFENKNLQDKVKQYSAQWDEKTERVKGLEAWGKMVEQDIIAECEAHARDTWDKVPKDWKEQEEALLDGFIEHHTEVFCGREGLLSEIKEHLLSPSNEKWGMILTGESGSGKSSVFSMTKKAVEKENCFVLAHSAGLSPRAKNVIDLLQIWISRLSKTLGVEDDSENMLKTEHDPMQKLDFTGFGMEGIDQPKQLPIEKLQERFRELLFTLAEKQQVVLLLDALDRFESTERAKFMTWLPVIMPGNIRMLCTAITGTQKDAVQYHNALFARDIDHFTREEARDMLQTLCKRQSKTLPQTVENLLLEKQQNDQHPACSSPLWLSLAVNMLMALDNDDFERMRQLEGRGDMQIETYMVHLAEGFPALPGLLFLNLVEKAGDLFGEEFTKNVFNYIAISRNGLREKDLEKLLTEQLWDPLQFTNLRRWFKAHLALQGEDLQWNLAHSILKIAVADGLGVSTSEKLHNSIAAYLTQLENDPLKASETMYHLLQAADAEKTLDYFISDLNETERTGTIEVLTEEIITNEEKGIEQAIQLIEKAKSNDEHLWALARWYIFELDYSLGVRGRPKERLRVLEELLVCLNKTGNDWKEEENHVYNYTSLHERLGFIYQSMGHMEEALTYFKNYNHLSKELHNANPRSESMKNGLSDSYEKLGSIHQSMGHMEEAIKYYELNFILAKELFESNPRSESLKKSLAISYQMLGLIHESIGHMEEALKNFESFNSLMKELYEFNPRSEDLKDGLAISYQYLGSLNKSMGKMKESLTYFKNYNHLSKELHEANPRSESLKNSLAISYHHLGSIHQLMGHMEEALKYYEFHFNLAKELFESNSHSEKLKIGLAISYQMLGWIYMSMGKLEEALKNFENFNTLEKEIYESNPLSEELKNLLAISYQLLGEIHQSMGHMEEALINFEIFNKLEKEIYESNPRSEKLKHGLAVSYNKLGNIHKSLGHMEEALTYFKNDNHLSKELHEANLQSESMKNGLAISYENLGSIHQAMGYMEEALTYFEQRNQLQKELYEANPQNVTNLENFGISFYKLAMYHKALQNHEIGKKYFEKYKSINTKLADKHPKIKKFADRRKEEYETGNPGEVVFQNKADSPDNLIRVKELIYDGQPLDALAILKEINKKNDLINNAMGVCYLRLGSLEKARETFLSITRKGTFGWKETAKPEFKRNLLVCFLLLKRIDAYQTVLKDMEVSEIMEEKTQRIIQTYKNWENEIKEEVSKTPFFKRSKKKTELINSKPIIFDFEIGELDF